MADRISQSERSRIMAQIRAKNTKPELAVRRALHRLGFRFRLHRKDLPGKPDIVLAKHRAIIQVHGCFWHQHPSKKCKLAKLPKSRVNYWTPKLNGNRLRDDINEKRLKSAGWRVLTIWECQLEDADSLNSRLTSFLGQKRDAGQEQTMRGSGSIASRTLIAAGGNAIH